MDSCQMNSRDTSRISVLLVDADHELRTIRSHLLALEDDISIVGEVASGEETLALVGRHGPDVVLLSSPLPGCDDLALARELRARAPRCALVMLSTDQGATLRDALSAGARGVLPTAASGRSLINAIRSVHAGGRHVDCESVSDALTRHKAPAPGQ
jgi:two-component system response regulator DesR